MAQRDQINGANTALWAALSFGSLFLVTLGFNAASDTASQVTTHERATRSSIDMGARPEESK